MLRLNCYNGNSNFGDALAKSLVERLSGQMVVHGTCYESQLMAAGSVFGDGSCFVAGEGKADADASKKIIASSMHALIVADSLGIPNRRLKFSEFFRENDKRQYDQSDFKFKDYYSAFGMESPKCMTEDELLKDPMAAITDISDRDFVPSEKVDACKCGLLAAFPESLKNEQRVTSAAKSPKLSVIIPVFNAELYLHECLASVLTQDAFGDFEVICVNDGSTDSSKDILSYWADRDARLKVLTQDNQGPGVARNVGLSVAKGEYITFLDADDRLTSGANLKAAFDHAVVNRLDVEALASNNGPDVGGKWSDNRHLRRELVPQKKVFAPEDVGINLFLFVVQDPWAKLYRREFVTANKLRFPALKRSEDFPFVMSALLLSQRIGVLDVSLCDHRVGVDTSLESTKDETPCVFIDAEKWFCNSINLSCRAEWVKLAFRISQVIRSAYNLRAVRKYSSFRNILSCLCDNFENLLQRVDTCQFVPYTDAYEFLCLIKRSDDDSRMELFVDNRVKRQVRELKKKFEQGCEEDRLRHAKLRSTIGGLRELNERLVSERQVDRAKIAELRGGLAGIREERDRLKAEHERDKAKIGELRGAVVGLRETRDRLKAELAEARNRREA